MPTSALAYVTKSPKTIGDRHIILRGDDGIAPYDGIIHSTAKL